MSNNYSNHALKAHVEIVRYAFCCLIYSKFGGATLKTFEEICD